MAYRPEEREMNCDYCTRDVDHTIGIVGFPKHSCEDPVCRACLASEAEESPAVEEARRMSRNLDIVFLAWDVDAAMKSWRRVRTKHRRQLPQARARNNQEQLRELLQQADELRVTASKFHDAIWPYFAESINS
jgi:hypothetical protein